MVVCVLCVWYHEVFNILYNKGLMPVKKTLLLLGSEWDKSSVVEVSVLLRCGTASLND